MSDRRAEVNNGDRALRGAFMRIMGPVMAADPRWLERMDDLSQLITEHDKA